MSHLLIVEYKHFPTQPKGIIEKPRTTIVAEFSNADGDPYYPVLSDRNLEMYKKYEKLSEKERDNNIFFAGRLALYRYYDMSECVRDAIKWVLDHTKMKLEDLNIKKVAPKVKKKPTMTISLCYCKGDPFSLKHTRARGYIHDWTLTFYKMYKDVVDMRFLYLSKCNLEHLVHKYYDQIYANYSIRIPYEIHKVSNVGRDSQCVLHYLLGYQNRFADLNMLVQDHKHNLYFYNHRTFKRFELSVKMLNHIWEDLQRGDELFEIDLRRSYYHYLGLMKFIPMGIKGRRDVELWGTFCDYIKETSRDFDVNNERKCNWWIVNSGRKYNSSNEWLRDQYHYGTSSEMLFSRAMGYRVLSRFRHIMMDLYCRLTKDKEFPCYGFFGEMISSSWFKGVFSNRKYRRDQLFSVCHANTAITTYFEVGKKTNFYPVKIRDHMKKYIKQGFKRRRRLPYWDIEPMQYCYLSSVHYPEKWRNEERALENYYERVFPEDSYV